MFFAAQFLQLVVGMSPLSAAMVLLPGLVVTVLAVFVAVRLVRVIPAYKLVSASFAMSALGYAIASFAGTPSMRSIMVAFAVLGMGIGLAETLTNDIMLTSVAPHKAGAAAAISETAYEIGAVLGTAVLGSILTMTYRTHLSIPAAAQWGDNQWGDNQPEFQTLGGTLEKAAQYPNFVGEDLLRSAHAAFDLGIQRSSAAAIVIALAAAVLSFRTLRGATGMLDHPDPPAQQAVGGCVFPSPADHQPCAVPPGENSPRDAAIFHRVGH